MAAIPKEVMERLRQVANLTSSTNAHEAAVAARKLQEMLQKYQLSLADIPSGSVGEDVVESLVDTGRQDFLRCEKKLMGAIVSGLGGQLIFALRGRRAYFRVVAHASDTEFAVWLYGHLRDAIRKASKANAATMPARYRNRYMNNFMEGAAAAIFQRLSADSSTETSDVDCRALVLLKSSAVDAHMREHHSDIPTARQAPRPKSFFGMRDGLEFGKQASLARPVEAQETGALSFEGAQSC